MSRKFTRYRSDPFRVRPSPPPALSPPHTDHPGSVPAEVIEKTRAALLKLVETASWPVLWNMQKVADRVKDSAIRGDSEPTSRGHTTWRRVTVGGQATFRVPAGSKLVSIEDRGTTILCVFAVPPHADGQDQWQEQGGRVVPLA